MKYKRGQAWGFDLIVASVIFTVGIVLFYLYSINYPTETQEKTDLIFYEGNLISEDLLSEGHPQNWNETNVIRIGLLSEGKINQTKLDSFRNLVDTDYARTKSLFNTKYNYYIEFPNTNIEIIGQQEEVARNLIKITRFTIYDNKPVSLIVYVWE